ncbi:HAD family hydrolase [Streptomyces sp. NPDC057654]|uniref:HAD family hydrolase n=1 Tax=Streptomyces sp. NPDC057654 TaxID=3346196 RepID=UPI003696F3C8
MHTVALFDLDGTLVNSEPRSRAAWSRLFRRHKVPHDDATLRAFAGRPGKEALADHLHSFHGRTLDELYEEAVAYSSHPDLPAAEPVAGALELLARLRRQHVPLGLVTSGPRDYARAELGNLGVLDAFDVLITADDVTRGKPDPQGYLAGCAALDAEPARAVVFEDAPAGVRAAKSAGIFCVGLTTTQSAAALAGADVIMADLTQVTWPILPVPEPGQGEPSPVV